MEEPDRSIGLLRECQITEEFLQTDLRHRGEVGFCVKESGVPTHISRGDKSSVTFVEHSYSTTDNLAVVHTHPSTLTFMDGGLSTSNRDIEMLEKDSVGSMVVLAQQMFEPIWDGKVVWLSDDCVQTAAFTINIEGVIDGPKEERVVDDFSIKKE